MIRAFFEGPAGSGKTHQMIGHAQDICGEMITGEHTRLLALTFMNGARRRLNARFGAVPKLRGRFVCLTIDSFAGFLVHRRRTLLRSLPQEAHDASLSAFDRTCVDAARLLELAPVAAWVGASYPLVVVDEAQDLNPHRFRILKALAACSCVIAAADEFQNLNHGVDTAEVMEWLRGAGQVTPLSTIRRTSQDGLLRVAGALRAGTSVCGELTAQGGFHPCHVAAGVRLIEPPAKNVGSLAWAVADELSRMSERAVILTPDAQGNRVREVLDRVQAEPFNRNKKTGATFGPYPLTWERRDEEEAGRLLEAIPGDGVLSLSKAIEAADLLDSSERQSIRRRLERARNVRGETSITRERLREVIEDVLRDAGRFGPRQLPGRRVMTIPRAKNREFSQVVVLWPHSVGGGVDQQRRLLYNAVTRTIERCSIVVFGQGRTGKAPFAGD